MTLEERKIGAAWMFENAAPDHSKKVFFALRQTLADFRARIVDRDRVAKVTPQAEPESSVHLQIVEQTHETRLDYGSVVRLSQFVSELGPSPFGRGWREAPGEGGHGEMFSPWLLMEHFNRQTALERR